MNARASTFLAYLWKEWRDHRVVIVAYLVAAPLLLAIAFTAVGDGWWATSRDWPTIGAFVGFAVAALAFGADLVAGEMRRGRLGFLARLPADLRGAFLGKLAFFALVLATFAVWTWAATSIGGALLKSAPWFPPLATSKYGPLGWGALVGASWILAVSCWMPRGTFALPATALALAAWLAPVIGAFLLNPGMKLRDVELERAASWLALAGVGVAALSFLRGWRWGGTIRSRIAWSFGPALLAFAPVWGWAALRVHEYRHLDPRAASFGLYATALGAGGRFAFITGYHTLRPAVPPNEREEYGATHPLIVDVATGAWREVGNPGDLFWHLGHRWERASARSVLIVAEQTDPRVPIASQFTEGIDGATGEPLTSEQWKPLLRGAGVSERVAQDESDFLILPDGRRAWAAAGRILVATPAGEVRELPCDSKDRAWWARGHGFVGDQFVYDCTRERSWRRRSGYEDVLFVRAGKWIVRRTAPGSKLSISLWDPERDELSPVRGMTRGEVRALLPDGRVVVVEPAVTSSGPANARDTGVGGVRGALVLLDPESGVRRELPLPPRLGEALADGWFHGFGPAGDLLLTLHEAVGADGERHDWIARLDPRTDELVAVGPFGGIFPDVLGSPDRDHVVFVVDHRRLVRAGFDGAPAETLFPR